MFTALFSVDATADTRPGTRAEELRRALADDIVSGRLRPGTRLDEQTLADRFKVSRTPVREALKHLAASGLAAAEPRRGVIVAGVTERRLRDMFETMGELEGVCARLCALRMTAGERRALADLHERSAALVRAGDWDGYDASNTAFHAAIYRGGHNLFLAEETLSVRARLAPFRRAQFRVLGRLSKSFAEHAAVVTAIDRADGDGAYRAMVGHVGKVSDASDDYLASIRETSFRGAAE